MIYLYNKKQLFFYKASFKYLFKRLIPVIICSILIGYTISSVSHHPNVIEEIKYNDRLVLLEEPIMNDTILADYLKKYKIKFPHIVMAQALHESGRFTSGYYMENNNLFGLKYPGSRPTTALGVRNQHSYYKNWEMSIVDYALYQAAFLRQLNTEDKYLQYLNQYYAEDSIYDKKLKQYLQETKQYFK